MLGNTTAAIVILEDDAIVRLATMEFFETRGSAVVAGETGSEVAALIAEMRLHPTLIVADYRLGATTAIEEVPEIMAALPADVIVVVTTGDTSANTRTLIEACGWRLLAKPYQPENLIAMIGAA